MNCQAVALDDSRRPAARIPHGRGPLAVRADLAPVSRSDVPQVPQAPQRFRASEELETSPYTGEHASTHAIRAAPRAGRADFELMTYGPGEHAIARTPQRLSAQCHGTPGRHPAPGAPRVGFNAPSDQRHTSLLTRFGSPQTISNVSARLFASDNAPESSASEPPLTATTTTGRGTARLTAAAST